MRNLAGGFKPFDGRGGHVASLRQDASGETDLFAAFLAVEVKRLLDVARHGGRAKRRSSAPGTKR